MAKGNGKIKGLNRKRKGTVRANRGASRIGGRLKPGMDVAFLLHLTARRAGQ